MNKWAILINGTTFYWFESPNPTAGRSTTEDPNEALDILQQIKETWPGTDYVLVTLKEWI